MESGFDHQDIDQDQAHDQDEGAFLGEFRIQDDDADQVDADFVPVDEGGEPVVDDGPRVMSLDAWQATWELAWNAPGMVIPKYAPLGITRDKKPASDAAAQAVFELAQDHFPWMIEERGGVLGAVLAIGPFASMQFGAMREIQAQERKARQERREAAQAANTNAPPQEATRASAQPAQEAVEPPHTSDWYNDDQEAA